MTQGILERIEAKQDQILEILTQQTVLPTVEETVDLSGDEPVPTPSTPPVPEVAACDDVELDSDGVPWDERIHSSSKKRSKGGKGPWVKRKNLPDGLHKQVTEELKKSVSAPAANGSDGVSVPPPPPATSKAAPPPPKTSGAPIPPAKTSLRGEAVAALNKVAETYNVHNDALVSYYIDIMNAPSFEDIQESQYPQVIEDMSEWFENLNSATEIEAKIKAVYASDVSVIEPFLNDIYATVSLNGEVCQHYTNVPFDFLPAVLEKLEALLASCSE